MIPARYGSTRFPGKLLEDLGGRPVLAHVIRRALESGLDRVVVAVDDPRLAAVAEAEGVASLWPQGDFRSGTDRIAAAVDLLESTSGNVFAPDEIVVNVQGDEPFLEPELIRRVAGALREEGSLFETGGLPVLDGRSRRADMSTAATPATRGEEVDPNAVKVVVDVEGFALYFSRATIPHRVDGAPAAPRLRHLGIYAYRRAFLARFVAWPPGRLEQSESLEQLRALEHGAGIRVVEVTTRSVGIDTRDDLEQARARLAAGGSPPTELQLPRH